MSSLSQQEQERYQRQVSLEEWGEEAQEAIKGSRVLVAGLGGLGSPVSLYLAAAGIGSLLLWDRDEVALSNLNRQILYSTDDLGREKSPSAAGRLSRLNPNIKVEGVSTDIDPESLERIARRVDLIVDCLDSMSTRFVLNRFAVSHNIPLVHGGVHGTNGQVTLIPPGGRPCLECIFSGMEDKSGVPVLGAAVGVVGSMEALEALKVLGGYGRTLAGRLLICEGFSARYQEIELASNPQCPVCGDRVQGGSA